MTEFVQVGDAVPTLTLPHLDGDEVDLDQYRGRKLLLFMWASW